MNENVNSPAKWLRYLLYVGIASVIEYLLGASLLGNLSRWIGYALSGASIYLLYQLMGANARYQKSVIFYGAALVVNILGFKVLSLVGSICAIVAQYLEYHAHSELVAARDPELAGKWNSLFWIQFVVELIGGLVVSMLVGIVAASGEVDSAPVIAIATVAIAFITPVLKLLYLIYLSRTIKVVETEFVV